MKPKGSKDGESNGNKILNTTKNNAKNIYKELLIKKTPAKQTGKIEVQGSIISESFKVKQEPNKVSVLERKNTYGTPLNHVNSIGNNIHHAKNSKTISTLNKNKSLASNLTGKFTYNKPNLKETFTKHGSAMRLNNLNPSSTNHMNHTIQTKSYASKNCTPKNNTTKSHLNN